MTEEGPSRINVFDHLIENYYNTDVQTEESEKYSALASGLIEALTAKNVAAWDELTDTPSNIIKYYRESFDRLNSCLTKNPEYEAFRKGYAIVKLEVYHYLFTYLSSAGKTIYDILSNLSKANVSDTAQTLESDLIALLVTNLEKISKEEIKSDECLSVYEVTRFFFELRSFIESGLTKMKKEELDYTERSTTKLIVKTPKEKAEASLILMACKYSSDSYMFKEKRKQYEGKWFGDTSETKVEGQEQWSGLVDYCEEHKSIVVAFHGTRMDTYEEMMQDCLTDLDFVHTPDEDDMCGANVHRGFYSRYNAVKDEMKTLLRTTIDNLDRTSKAWDSIIVTGHSLGGALATLAAINLVNDKKSFSESERKRIRLITFCQPRVLSKKAHGLLTKKERPETEALEKNAIRIWRKGDFVPTLPPGSKGYKHFGQSWCIAFDYSAKSSFHPDKHKIDFVQKLLESYVHGVDIDMTLEEKAHVAKKE